MSEQGAPSKYKPEYDEQIIELAKSKTMYSIAAKWNVCFDSLQEWQRVHPTFSSAYKRARTIQTARLLEDMYENAGNREYNHQIAALLLTHVARLSNSRMVQVDGMSKGTLNDKANRILESVERGNLTADEVSKLTSAVAQATKIEEITNVREELNAIKEKMKDKR
jgi:hypothetical protein